MEDDDSNSSISRQSIITRDLDPETSLGKIKHLQYLLKEVLGHKYFFQHNKDALIEKLQQTAIELYKTKLAIHQTYVSASHASSQNEYVFINIDKKFTELEVLSNFFFFLRSNPKYVIGIIDKLTPGQYDDFANMLGHLFYENVLISSSSLAQEELLIIIYLLIEKELNLVAKPSDLNKFLESDFLSSLIISLIRKDDFRIYLSNLLSEIILEIENDKDLLLTLELSSIKQAIEKKEASDKKLKEKIAMGNYYTHTEGNNNGIDLDNDDNSPKKKGSIKPSQNKQQDYNMNDIGIDFSTRTMTLATFQSKGYQKKPIDNDTTNNTMNNPRRHRGSFIKQIKINKDSQETLPEDHFNNKALITISEEYYNQSITKNVLFNIFNKKIGRKCYQKENEEDHNESEDDDETEAIYGNFIKPFIELQLNHKVFHKNEQAYSIDSFLDNITKYQNIEPILIYHHSNYNHIQILINHFLQKLNDTMPSLPYLLKAILSITDTLLIQKKFEAIHRYPFIAKMLFNKIIINMLTKSELNGTITNSVISAPTRPKLKVLEQVIAKISEGNLFNSFNEKDKDYISLNNYLMKLIPKVMALVSRFTSSKKMPDIIREMIDKKNTPNRDNLVQYDFFQTYPDENIQHQAICFNEEEYEKVYKIIKENMTTFNNDETKEVIPSLLLSEVRIRNQMKTIKQKECGNTNINSSNKKMYYYISRMKYRGDFKERLNAIRQHYSVEMNIYLNDNDINAMKKIKNCITTIIQHINIISISTYDIEVNDSLKKIIYKLNKIIKLEGLSDYKVDNKIPLSWYGLFLDSNYKSIPEIYSQDNYAKLYDELITETTHILSEIRNDTINQIYHKITLAEKKNIILNGILVKLKQMDNIMNIEKFVGRKRFEIGIKILNENNPKTMSMQIITEGNLLRKGIKYHCDNITSFIEQFPDFRQNLDIGGDLNDYLERKHVPQELNKFFAYLKNLITSDRAFNKYSKDDIDATTYNLEDYIHSKIYNKLYQEEPTEADMTFYDKCLRMDFIKPEHLLKKKKGIEEKLWVTAKNYINAMDKDQTPINKIKSFQKAYSIIENSIAFSTGKGELGVDDNMPVLMYIVIKAKPKRVYSNLGYVKQFLNSELGEYANLLSQLEMVIEAASACKYSDLIDVHKEDFNTEDDFI